MATAVLKVFAAVFLVVVASGGAEVSAENHHVVGGDDGWGPALNISSWLSGRVFRVGDKIWFKYSGTEDSIIELQGLEEFLSCNFTNPIKMYTDPVTHVSLEKEGVRYFTSGNLENCQNGLKLPVPVRAPHEFGPAEPLEPTPEFGPPEPFEPTPEFGPPEPFPEYGPPPPPPHPIEPPPFYVPPPPPTAPSAATHLNGLPFVLAAGFLSCFVGI